jgi:hypothetical protein
MRNGSCAEMCTEPIRVRWNASVVWLLAIVIVALSSATAESAKTRYFTFRNGFWLNLHHTLFHEASLQTLTPEQHKQRGMIPLDVSALTPQERNTWEKAIAFYRSRYKDRGLLFDDELVNLGNALSRRANDPSLQQTPAIPDEVRAVLKEAAPVYRKHWWPRHQRSNQLWIERMRPRVTQFSPKVIPQLEKIMKSEWPAADRVDVSYFVVALGNAYTTTDPGHTTIASSRETNSGDSGLEIVFHEGAHLLTRPLQRSLSQDCQAQHADCGDLWHAIQFFTVGEVVKQELAQAGTSGYEPYALKFGLYRRGRWSSFLPLIRKEWQPYMEGRMNFEEAIKALGSDVKHEPSNAVGQPASSSH